jgi:hypothetical protein
VKIGEANADRHSATRSGFRPKPRGDSVSEMTQRGPKDPFFRRLLAECRLGSGRLSTMMRPDFPGIAIPRQRGQLFFGRPA